MDISCEKVDRLAAELAKAEGLDWNEKCGFEAGLDDCDSGTCIAAHYEDHDAEYARGYFRRAARTALKFVEGGDA